MCSGKFWQTISSLIVLSMCHVSTSPAAEATTWNGRAKSEDKGTEQNHKHKMLPDTTTAVTQAQEKEGVILLHGLCRTPASMRKMQKALEAEGYAVHVPGYESRKYNIDTLSTQVIPAAMQSPTLADCRRIHFVTHSLGGILVRNYFSRYPDERANLKLGRVVMLAPPNQGSEVTDHIRHWAIYRWLNGPAGMELGTDSDSQPKRLGPANFEVGIITGNLTINWINSFLMIPGPGDGKVSLESAKLEGMKDYLVLPTSHPFVMKNGKVMKQVKAFLKEGRFTASSSR